MATTPNTERANPILTAVAGTLIGAAITGAVGWSFSTSVGGFEKRLDVVEARLRKVESGEALKEFNALLLDVRERVVRIEVQLASDRKGQ